MLALALLTALASLPGQFREDLHPVRTAAARSDPIGDAYRDGRSGIWVSGTGAVVRILADDDDGDRHQRFIPRLRTGQTLLVAQNIDLAPRLDSLRIGDFIDFTGMYEWNDKGGLIHWTHHDPGRRRSGGWLRREGRVFR